MKKLLAFTLAVLTILVLCSCGGNKEAKSDGTDNVTDDTNAYADIENGTVSEGLFLRAEGKAMVIIDGCPTEMVNKTENTDLFSSFLSGDLITVVHTEVRELYPASTDVYEATLKERGSFDDIPEEIIHSLRTMGWTQLGEDTNVCITDPPLPDETPENGFSWQATDYEVGYNSEDSIELSTALICSTEELSAYIENNSALYIRDEYCEPYNEEFFEEKYLVIVYQYAYSGMVERHVSDVTHKNDSICITIEEYCPALHTDDCSGWAHFVAVSRYVKLESPDDIIVSIDVLAPFSYTDDMYFLGDDRTLITEGFINTDERETITEVEAIELGYAEMTQIDFEYVGVTVSYDNYEDMWRVEFLSSQTEETVVLVYIRSNGVTEAIII